MHFACAARRLALLLLVSFPASSLFAQTFTALATFNAGGGYYNEYGGLTQGRDGNIYGIAGAGTQRRTDSGSPDPPRCLELRLPWTFSGLPQTRAGRH